MVVTSRFRRSIHAALFLGGAGFGAALLHPAFSAPAAGPASLRGKPAKPQSGSMAMAGSSVRTPAPKPGGKIDFDRDVRPILSENCFTCHGFDENKRVGGLRLDLAEAVLKPAASGKPAIVPGKPDASELMKRVLATNARQMPPESSHKTLTKAQIETLRRWIAQGGQYSAHWAFVAPKKPTLPAVSNQAWARTPIDRFVLARLESEGLKPSPEADRATLIRRLSFDLTGLPPTPAEVAAFQADTEPGAYERLVDRLLASPNYGERMAVKWLDLARYADTHGYHIDSHRDMWPWRDWVIRTFNENKPFDQFTIEQLAGDLLPNPTLDQRIATGFNRNHPINFEGGAIPEEYHTAYIFDRIDTTSTTWLALTVGCAQCHSHKYDPITQKDYYKLFAYFFNVPEAGLDGFTGNARPFIKAPSPEQRVELARLDQSVAKLEGSVKARAATASAGQAAWEQSVKTSGKIPDLLAAGLVARYPLDETSGAKALDLSGRQAPGNVKGEATWTSGKLGGAFRFNGSTAIDLGTTLGFDRQDRASYGGWVNPANTQHMTVMSRMEDGAGSRGWDLYLGDGKVYVHLINTWASNALRVNTKTALPVNQWSHVFATYDGSSKAAGVKVYINGKPAELEYTNDNLTESIKVATPAYIGQRNPGAKFNGALDDLRFYDRTLAPEEVAQLAGSDGAPEVLAIAPEQRTPAQKEALTRYYLENVDAEYRTLSAELTATRKHREELDKAIPTTMVMEEMPTPRESFILVRGQYNVKGEKVTPGTPSALPAMPASFPNNRLGLAKWLVDPSNPLTSRVAVNRFWQMLYGQGLVRTAENFGTQGERPSHPELLDYLAVRFREGVGADKPWDMKALLKLLVTSATYRQSSKASPALLARDPENRLLARGPRFRLPAEFIRDQALVVSGLLVKKIGGPSVKPYQPSGLWEEIAFGGNFTAQSYTQDKGENLYRRSMYTFWKRTLPPPSLQTFDAPEREVCMVKRSVSNTPLQALVLWNDPTYVEASRKFAERLMTEVTALPKDRVRYAYRLLLNRNASNEELRVISQVYEEQVAQYRHDKAAAEKLLAVGESPRNAKLDVAELAAWTSVANVLFNLDEVITKN